MSPDQNRNAGKTTTRVTLSSTTLIDTDHQLAAEDIAHACGCRIEWVVELTEAGIIDRAPGDSPPAGWRFASIDLQRALEAR
ncbi:MAG: hypothetical protein ABIW85_00600, partial [Variovorax sp.]